MSRVSRTVTVATVASLGLLVGGLVTVGGLSGLGSGATPSSAAATPADDATTSAAPPLISVAPESVPETTATNSGFVDGAAASEAAEDLLTGYITSQLDADVTDPACSEPPTGAIGETFACYALKPGDLVIALRATIGEERLVTLELITNQVPTTTTVPDTVPDADTTEP